MTANSSIVGFESFVTEGDYKLMKQHEAFLKQSKAYLEEELKTSNNKRHEFPNVNMVAKFVAKEIRNTNEEGLIEDIFDYVKPELALPLFTLDSKKMKDESVDIVAKPYLLPATYYVRPYLNKIGKQHVNLKDYLFGGQTLEQLVTEIYTVTKSYKKTVSEYEKVKDSLFDYLDQVEMKKVTTKVGSVSRIAHRPSWDMNGVLENLGEEFVQIFGKVNLSLLDEWIISGKIPRKILTDNRTVVDIRLDFIVIPLDVEARILNFSKRKRSDLSLRRHEGLMANV